MVLGPTPGRRSLVHNVNGGVGANTRRRVPVPQKAGSAGRCGHECYQKAAAGRDSVSRRNMATGQSPLTQVSPTPGGARFDLSASHLRFSPMGGGWCWEATCEGGGGGSGSVEYAGRGVVC